MPARSTRPATGIGTCRIHHPGAAIAVHEPILPLIQFAMNTPAHLILGLGVLSRPDSPKVNLAAAAGSLLPDLSLYLLGSYALFVSNVPPGIVFGEMYYSDAWQRIFAIDNSVFVWLCAGAAGWWFRRDWLMVFGIAGILHVATDLPLHHDDGRQHFWPISDWIFESPISYWDPSRYGGIVGPLEVLLCMALAVWMFRRFRSLGSRAMILLLAASEVLPALGPVLFF